MRRRRRYAVVREPRRPIVAGKRRDPIHWYPVGPWRRIGCVQAREIVYVYADGAA